MREWELIHPNVSARFYKNGRTDVRNELTKEVVTSHSPSLQDALRAVYLDGPLIYLFGGQTAESMLT